MKEQKGNAEQMHNTISPVHAGKLLSFVEGRKFWQGSKSAERQRPNTQSWKKSEDGEETTSSWT